jgi:hypothetical protein
MSKARYGLALGLALMLGCSDSESGRSESDGDPGSKPGSKRVIDAGSDSGIESTDAASHDAAAAADAGLVIHAPDKTWQRIDFPDAICRDGSPGALLVNLNGSSKQVMIYLEGGGGCYDAQTCAGNPSAAFQTPGDAGVFDRTNAHNPVGDWSFVYVPYCSGDQHMGDAADVSIPGVDTKQQFKGRPNLEHFLARIVPTFADADQVLLTGASAGGSGALMSYRVVQAAFGSIPVTLIDDSGPLYSTDFVPGCAAELRRKYWGLDGTILKECGADCTPDDANYPFDYGLSTIALIPRASGLIESIHDETIRSFIGIASNDGKNDCMGVLGTTVFDQTQFEAAMLDLRKHLQASAPKFGTYFPNDTQHVWINNPLFYSAAAGPDHVTLVDWFGAILDDEQAAHVGP